MTLRSLSLFPRSERRHDAARSRPRGFGPALLGVLGAALALAGCGGDDSSLRTYDIHLVTQSDCSQVGQGAVSCEDPEALAALSVSGQWVFDYRGADTFVVTTDEGRAVPGIFFNNTGDIETTACTGQGGVCHFARARKDELDVESSCFKIRERVIDVYIQDDDTLTGQLSDVQFTDETCGTSLVTEVIVQVQGTLADETVAAREAF